jgi:hypothetical protein
VDSECKIAIFEVSTVTRVRIVVFWVVIACSTEGGNKVSQNLGILPHNCMEAQPRTPFKIKFIIKL